MSEANAAQPAQETPNAGQAAPAEQKVEAAEQVQQPALEAKAPAEKPAESAAPTKEAVVTEGSESKAPEEQKPVVPEKYDLKLPEGSQLEAGVIEEISSLAKEKGLSNEAAQAVLEHESKAVATFVEAKQKEFRQKADVEWLNELKADKNFGGEALKVNAELAHRVLKRFGSDDLNNVLKETGYGNHPELFRAFVRIGKAMSEDQLVIPGAQTGGTRAIEDIFYGKGDK